MQQHTNKGNDLVREATHHSMYIDLMGLLEWFEKTKIIMKNKITITVNDTEH